MDFEEMQAVWDSQKEKRVYALDLEALHAIVKRRGRRIEIGVNAMEVGMLVVCVAAAAFLAAEPIFQGTDRDQYLGAGVLLAVAAWIVRGRVRRRNREHGFGPSLLGDLDRALSQVDYHIARARTFHWWFMLPAFVIILVSFVTAEPAKSPWIWLGIAACFAASNFLVRWELRCTHLPRKRDLEALRSKLLDGG